jgi:hypothetical protein
MLAKLRHPWITTVLGVIPGPEPKLVVDIPHSFELISIYLSAGFAESLILKIREARSESEGAAAISD